MLRSGAIKRSRFTPDGDEVIAGFAFAGETIGLESIEGGMPDERFVALESTRLCEVPWENVEATMAQDPRVRDAVNRLLREEINRSREQLIRACRGTARQRVAAFLLDVGRRRRERRLNDVRIRLAMGRREMAAYLNLTLETVSRTISQLRREGMIAVEGRRLELLDIAGLGDIAEGLSSP
ncbi:MAG: helix-turn-helix domain-containing protein [Arhodomonas sp.]|nr:helix-turn-helix domain-containing protein [Arhodomonas sp.]